ncbi:MAG TPA: SCO family protein [Chthoniobacteraceae bacterium]|nr:SCO family protein [Chthoniobacteraceae bacterium]
MLAQERLPARADLEQKLGAQVPLDLVFTDETGKAVPLRSYFGKVPVILQLGYNHCWLMCDVITGALVRSMQDLKLTPGSDFEVLFVSIDPSETWQLAAKKRADYIRSYGRDRAGRGWHFLTGKQADITALTQAVGFHYFYIPKNHQFAHPSGIIVLTPQGVTSKYFYGVEFDPELLRQALIDAKGGAVGSRVEALLLLCCEWNPLTGKYGVAIAWALKIFCLGTVALLGAYMFVWLRRDARKRRLDETGSVPQ